MVLVLVPKQSLIFLSLLVAFPWLSSIPFQALLCAAQPGWTLTPMGGWPGAVQPGGGAAPERGRAVGRHPHPGLRPGSAPSDQIGRAHV